MLWPLPLFVAGIETVDEVWADRVRMFMAGVEVESGRGGNERMLALLEEVRRRQEENGGRRVVVSEVLAERGEKSADMFVF
jgi:hypothetical protein